MKIMMNGALTIGTLDGVYIEILEEVDEDNFFLFSLTEEQVEQVRYGPMGIINADDDIKRVIDLFETGHFNQFEVGIFDTILGSIKSPHDPWMTLADFRSFIDAQKRLAEVYHDKDRWTRMSIINCASSGTFSTDRTLTEYNNEICKLTPIKISTNGF
jgi:starch phosphorylase